MKYWKILILALICVLLGGITYDDVYSFGEVNDGQVVISHLDYQVFLPLIDLPDQFENHTTPIWAHNISPKPYEVALFRKSFVLNDAVETPTLSIFADTRYEIWVDGEWVGRGPARFLKNYHEYDQYQLENLSSGEHLIAILVQWSPNNRRSESSTPHVRAALHKKVGNLAWQLLRTDETWRVQLSTAWQSGAALIHAWGLLGSTELLDLRSYPVDWVSLNYTDTDWPFAVEVDPIQSNTQQPYIVFDYGRKAFLNIPVDDNGDQETVIYLPRSIKPLSNTEIDFEIIDQGVLSSGNIMVEILPSDPDPYQLLFENSNGIIFEMEMLISDSIPHPASILLDGIELTWTKVGGQRQDVYRASTNLLAGSHEVRIEGNPDKGVTLLVPVEQIVWNNIHFSQGVHAGRRLLLSSYTSNFNTNSQQNVLPEIVTLTELPSYILLDLGRTVHGRLQMDVSGPAGVVLDIGWDERLMGSDPARALPFPGSLHPEWNQVDSWVLDGSKRQISTIDARAGRYVLIAAWGQGSINLENIRIFEEHYPVVQSGNFESDNELLNKIWQIGMDSVLVSMTDAYADPWRERGQWWGDAYVVDRANRVTFGDTDLLQRGINLMAKGFGDDGRPVGLSPNGAGIHLIDYGMLWLHSLEEYLELTGDQQTAADLYPTVLRFMSYLDTFVNSETGLLDLPNGYWTGNSYIDTNGSESRYGQSTAVNSMYYETLLRAAQIASILGHQPQSITWKADAVSIKENMSSKLYLVDEHRYVTRIFEDEIFPPTAFAQAWPLAYEVVLPEEKDAVVIALFDLMSQDPNNPTINVYGMYWVLEALGQTGYITEAIDLIEVFYGHMLDRGATTWWEHFDANKNYWASLSHGWGSSPTWFLSTYVLGARWVDENSWIVQPPFEGVGSVSGQIPIKDDVLGVYWDQPDCQEQNIQISSPKESTGQVVVSIDNSLEWVMLDGEIVWQNGISNIDNVWMTSTDVFISLEEGDFSVNLHRTCK